MRRGTPHLPPALRWCVLMTHSLYLTAVMLLWQDQLWQAHTANWCRSSAGQTSGLVSGSEQHLSSVLGFTSYRHVFQVGGCSSIAHVLLPCYLPNM